MYKYFEEKEKKESILNNPIIQPWLQLKKEEQRSKLVPHIYPLHLFALRNNDQRLFCIGLLNISQIVHTDYSLVIISKQKNRYDVNQSEYAKKSGRCLLKKSIRQAYWFQTNIS
jgi:hypothetical protein